MEPERSGFVTRLAGRGGGGEHRPMLRSIPILVAAACLVACAGIEAARFEERGRAALDRGDAAAAVADLEHAASLAPNASPIQNHLGIAYEQAGRRDDALRAYERAVELDCENEAATANLDALRAETTAR
jgi:Flp pilus assembly protein TadD